MEAIHDAQLTDQPPSPPSSTRTYRRLWLSVMSPASPSSALASLVTLPLVSSQVTKESFVDGGYFKTGDTVKVDEDGYYIILGRTSADIMKVGGYKLSALEIEAVLLEHPMVSECCVLRLPDVDHGEAVCAIIVHHPQQMQRTMENGEFMPTVSLKELQSWAKV